MDCHSFLGNYHCVSLDNSDRLMYIKYWKTSLFDYNATLAVLYITDVYDKSELRAIRDCLMLTFKYVVVGIMTPYILFLASDCEYLNERINNPWHFEYQDLEIVAR